jgi:N-carbamoyl-L-amino-acid hydrolase
MQMAKIGPGSAGGNNRQALSDDDAKARSLLRQWCIEAGLVLGVDGMGNIFARREGEDADALPVYVGSHLDTQPAGGRFDGVLGVLGGLEVIRSLNDFGVRTRHPIVLTNWTNEEGSRFAPIMMASGVFAGIHSQDWAFDQRDKDGRRFGDELERIGWKGSEVTGQRRMKAYFELHIEQGPVLEAENVDIGVVTGGQGLTWLQVKLGGREGHTGTTPMTGRRDAARGAALVTELVYQVAAAYHPNAVGSVGHVELHPNSRNSIAGSARLTIDIRSPDQFVLDAMEERIRIGISAVGRDLSLSTDIQRLERAAPVTFDETCVAAVRRAAESQGYSHRDILSGAGHDAFWISSVAPTAMIMCPCVGGLSHNEAEDIRPEWAEAGTNVLLHAVQETAERIS